MGQPTFILHADKSQKRAQGSTGGRVGAPGETIRSEAEGGERMARA